MQLKIRILLEKTCSLPLAYHYIIQSALYNLMKEPGSGYSSYHNEGVHYGSRVYRLFTFGLLKGVYHIENGRIIFSDYIDLEVRSTDEHCLRLIEARLKKGGIWLEGRKYQDIVTEVSNYTVEATDLVICMESPICVYATDRQTKHTTFFSPRDVRFFEAANYNFKRKYEAAFHEHPESGIELRATEIRDRDKYVTKYKNYYISGWKGKYYLSGKRKYLDFLYQTGLGAKNAQGFGMFRVTE